MTDQRRIPTGECWCGCGAETTLGAFFKPGHGKFAESAIIGLKWRTVANFVDEQGFGPGGRNARREWAARQEQK